MHVCVHMCTHELPHTNKEFLDASKMSETSAQFWHYLPRVRIGFHRYRALSHKTTLHFRPITSPGCYLYFSLIGSKSEVPMISSWGSVNLLEWLTKFRQMFYLADYWFTLKEYNSVTARWMRCIQQGVRKGWATSCHLWAIHSSKSQLTSWACSPAQLSEHCPCGVLWRPHYLNMTD